MPINLPGVPFKLTPQDMGGFDVSDALSKGFNLNKQFQEARTMPRKLAEELLQSQLKTKHDETINKYLDRSEQARIGSSESSTGLSNLKTQIAREKLNQDKEFYDLLSGKPSTKQSSSYQDQIKGAGKPGYMTPNGFEGSLTGIPVESNYSNTGEDRKAEQEAVDRIDRANNQNDSANNESFIPSFKSSLTQNSNNGMQQDNQNKPSKNPILERMNWIWDNRPQDRKRLKDIGFDKDKSSKNFAPTNTMKEIQAKLDIDDGFVPGTQRTQQFANPEMQNKYKQAYDHVMQQKEDTANAMNAGRIRRASGLKQDEDYIDTKGNVVNNVKEATAIRRPYSEREKKEQSGRRSFNITYPFILKATSYYSGKGSIKRFNDDIASFDTDPKAQKRILNYITASQLVTQGIIKEDATLGGANTNQVYNRLAKSLTSSDLPIKFEQLERQFRLPNSANLKAGLKFQEILNKSLKAGESLPSRTTEYLSGDHLGQMYNPQTGKVEDHLVSPEDWEAFKEAGGY